MKVRRASLVKSSQERTAGLKKGTDMTGRCLGHAGTECPLILGADSKGYSSKLQTDFIEVRDKVGWTPSQSNIN